MISFYLSSGLIMLILFALFVIIDIYSDNIYKWFNKRKIKNFLDTTKSGQVFVHKSAPRRRAVIVKIQDGEVFYRIHGDNTEYTWSLPVLSFLKYYSKQ